MEMVLKVDYISDLHMGFIIGNKRTNHAKVIASINGFVDSTIPEDKGDVLVIAGDVDEYNNNIVYTLNRYAEYYEKIFFVFGNHDLYLMSRKQQQKYGGDSRNRQEELKRTINDYPVLRSIVTVLDNKVVEYKGYKIAGSMLWYTHPLTFDKMWWEMNSNDSRKILPRGEEASEERHQVDMEFYRSLEDKEIDLLITHVPPVHLNDIHKPSASYYNVAISELGLYAKHWICGHQHTRKIKKIGDTIIYINASGYVGELVGEPKIKQMQI